MAMLGVYQTWCAHQGRGALEAIQAATGRFSAGLPQGNDQTLVLLSRTPPGGWVVETRSGRSKPSVA
jgi:hypothetical protein